MEGRLVPGEGELAEARREAFSGGGLRLPKGLNETDDRTPALK